MNRRRSRHPPSSGRLTRGHHPTPVQAAPPPPPPTPRPSVRWCGVRGQRTQTDDGPPPARGGCVVCCGKGVWSGVEIFSVPPRTGGAAVAVGGGAAGVARGSAVTPPRSTRAHSAAGCAQRRVAAAANAPPGGTSHPPYGLGDAAASGAPLLQGQGGQEGGPVARPRGSGAWANSGGGTPRPHRPPVSPAQRRGKARAGPPVGSPPPPFGGGLGADPPSERAVSRTPLRLCLAVAVVDSQSATYSRPAPSTTSARPSGGGHRRHAWSRRGHEDVFHSEAKGGGWAGRGAACPSELAPTPPHRASCVPPLCHPVWVAPAPRAGPNAAPVTRLRRRRLPGLGRQR